MMYRAFGRLFRAQDGAVLPLIAISVATLVAASGMAIDMARLQMVQSRLSNALDAAGLAAGSSVSTSDLQSEVNKYFNANFPAGYLDSTIQTPSAVPNSDNTLITLSVQGTVRTTFMQIFGVNNLAVRADSQITRQNKGMELVLVLDITGSMSGSKIVSLRNAATALVNTVYGSKTTIDNLWVGIVPYVTAVNIGNTAETQSWLTNYDLTLYPSGYPSNRTKWKGCVEERPYPYDMNAAFPSPTDINTRFPMYFWADTSSSGDNDWVYGGSFTIVENNSNSASGPNLACWQAVQPLRANKNTTLTSISTLVESSDNSGTMSNVGLVWAWRMLSPDWRGHWNHDLVGGQVKLPLNYNTDLMKKVVVLMTDGENQFYDSTSSDPPYSDYTAYKRLATVSNGGRADINTNNQNTARNIINDKTKAICAAMKAKGTDIIIYTVTFQLGSSTSQQEARTLFRDCATSPDYYFDAESQVSGAPQVDITTAFKTIGDSLANLRISK
ncbi:MAG: pilus assembly protein TadG-related protein [Rickettsiales bacterium]|nr:pilus assembly protein TadG-related protein [Rickettsiales bacterium]